MVTEVHYIKKCASGKMNDPVFETNSQEPPCSCYSPPTNGSDLCHVRCHPVPAGNSPEHRQYYPALRQYRRQAASREAAGFSLEDKQLMRAGLDYHEFATLSSHESWAECAERFKNRRLFAVSTKGMQRYDLLEYGPSDAFLFVPESCGLPAEVLGAVAERQRIRLPMAPGSRSLNLSNTVAVIIYEAWR